ncbi:MAG: NlpC/P60 family protein [Treponemataceae bacterium]
MVKLRFAFLTVALTALSFSLFGAPVATVQPKAARQKIADAAEAYLGVPYRFGGLDRSGLDCSGLVFLSMRDAVGARVPRTVRQLSSWTDPVDRLSLQSGDLVYFNTTGPLAHVGIYLGDNQFIHSASDGSKTGVIVSSLNESYWRRAYAGAGRIVPPADYLGILLAFAGGATGIQGPDSSYLRGAAFQLGAEYELFGFRPGLELRPEWDAALGVFRVPLTLSIGVGDTLRFFVGPALVLGNPELKWNGGSRSYAASGGLLASGGVTWMPFSFRSGAARVSVYGEAVWQRYEPAADEAEDFGADVAANFRASVGVRVRWGI